MNSYWFRVTEPVENMVELSKDFDWNDLSKTLGLKTGNEYKIIDKLLELGFNGLFYDFGGFNEYVLRKTSPIFSTVEIEINNFEVPTVELSGYHSSG